MLESFEPPLRSHCGRSPANPLRAAAALRGTQEFCERALAQAQASIAAAASVQEQWLLRRYRGCMPPPPIEQVAFLRSHEIADFDPGCLCLLGEERVSPPEWRREIALYSDYILHPSRLAKELEPASARVQSREEGERAWERAMELSSEVPLKVPCAEKAAAAAMAQDSWISFGRHAATLHVNPGFAAGKAGHLSMGQFENRHHERMGKGQIPVVTVDHLEFCLSVFRSLCMLPVWLHRPRLQLIKHCETVEHTDRQRGDTISACKFAERDRCALLFRLDVFMCVSLCRYRGVLVLPMSMHPDPEAKEPRVKGVSVGHRGEGQGGLPTCHGARWAGLGVCRHA